MTRYAFIVMAVVSVGTPSFAAVTPLSIQRTIRVAAETNNVPNGPNDQDSGERTSNEHGSFDDTLQVELSGAGATARQTSTVSPEQVTAVGSVQAGAVTIFGDIHSAASAASTLHYEFLADVNTPYEMEGSVHGILESQIVLPIDTRVTLRSADEVLFTATSSILTKSELWQGNDVVSFSHAGTLSPGIYTLEIVADATLLMNSERTERGSYTVSLRFVPEPASTTGTLAVSLPLIVVGCRRVARRPRP